MEKYAASSKSERKILLKVNPQYNERGDWTDEMWDTWNAKKKLALVNSARSWSDFALRQDKIKAESIVNANRFLSKSRRFKAIKLT